MLTVTFDSSTLKKKSINFVDMHCHSTFSDGNKSPEYLAKYFLKAKKGLCLTDHNEIRGSLYLVKKTKVFTIPSIEITSRNNIDILAYFYNARDLVNFWEKEIMNKIRRNRFFNLNRTTLSVFEIIDRIKKYNGISALTHPFLPKIFIGLKNPKDSSFLLTKKRFMKRVDLVEFHPHMIDSFWNYQGKILSLDKPLITGSDNHSLPRFNALTGTYEFDKEDFLDAVLNKQNVFLYLKRIPLLVKFQDYSVVFKNNFSIFNFEKNMKKIAESVRTSYLR